MRSRSVLASFSEGSPCRSSRPHCPLLCHFNKQEPEGFRQVPAAAVNTLTLSIIPGMFLKRLLEGERTLRLLHKK